MHVALQQVPTHDPEAVPRRSTPHVCEARDRRRNPQVGPTSAAYTRPTGSSRFRLLRVRAVALPFQRASRQTNRPNPMRVRPVRDVLRHHSGQRGVGISLLPGPNGWFKFSAPRCGVLAYEWVRASREAIRQRDSAAGKRDTSQTELEQLLIAAGVSAAAAGVLALILYTLGGIGFDHFDHFDRLVV